MWNGKDPILKERLFGLSIGEGSRGEDVKEYYFYLDSTPTHSYMKYLYKYPLVAFPYDDLIATNRDRGRGRPEYELLDTGVFDQDRSFDVFVEYAKASPEDMLIRITVQNRFSMSTSTGTPAPGSVRATRRDGPGPSRVSCIRSRLSIGFWMGSRTGCKLRGNNSPIESKMGFRRGAVDAGFPLQYSDFPRRRALGSTG